MGDELLRLFVAIEPPEAVREQLSDLVITLRKQGPSRGLRWVRPASIHLTLKFLGDTLRDKIPAIEQALTVAAAQAPRFDLTVAGLGRFPPKGRPRVLWAGLTEGAQALIVLQAAVESALVAAGVGIEPEGRPYSPHLTLARVKSLEASTAVDRLLERGEPGLIVTWRVDAISLVRSQLHPDGAIYTQLITAPLPYE